MTFNKIILWIFLASLTQRTEFEETFWAKYRELNEFQSVENITNIIAVADKGAVCMFVVLFSAWNCSSKK